MGMRMMFTVFLLVVLATTVDSFNVDRASDDRDSAAMHTEYDVIATDNCIPCSHPACGINRGKCR
uniref:Conotoxin Pu14.3 n=1 Tax=Conus pulicarius TaxID=93154 RepID=C6ZJQ4_CONPL|nr:conotoxin Pu14.3 [Conus pulicarius]